MQALHGHRKRNLLNIHFFKSGEGEVLAFLVSLPCLLLLLYTLVDVIHVGTIKERLEYTAYKAGRAAVVAENLEKANEIAYKTAKKDLVDNSQEKFDTSDPDWLTVEVTMADGSTYADIEDGPTSLRKQSPDLDEESGSNSTWEKGNFIQCTVTAKVKTYNVFSGNEKSASITMMIETIGDPSGEGVYPWFANM